MPQSGQFTRHKRDPLETLKHSGRPVNGALGIDFTQ